MKKSIIVFLLVLCIFSLKQVSASSYVVNEQSIDKLCEKATETSMLSFNSVQISPAESNFATPVMAAAGKDKSAVVAIVLDFFLGGLGIHRFYLGTQTMTGLGYILTCGGIFGIVPLIDFVVLIINNQNIGPYINNPKFFMWN
jgi:TM2 domain-containing membrane protein YozV